MNETVLSHGWKCKVIWKLSESPREIKSANLYGFERAEEFRALVNDALRRHAGREERLMREAWNPREAR